MNELERLKGRLRYWRENDDPMMDIDLDLALDDMEVLIRVIEVVPDVVYGYTESQPGLYVPEWEGTCYANYGPLKRLTDVMAPFLEDK